MDAAVALPISLPRDTRWPDGAIVVGVEAAFEGQSSVMLDAAAGVAAALRHVKDLGHRHVLYLGIRERGNVWSSDRIKAFEQATATLGLAGRVGLLGFDEPTPPTVDAIIARDRKAIRESPHLLGDATAVLCYNDNMGLALCSVLGERGVRVPDDISVVGFDDLSATCSIPPLTTISHMLPEMGVAAVDCAVDRIEAGRRERDLTAERIIVTPKLIVRESTGPAPSRAGPVPRSPAP